MNVKESNELRREAIEILASNGYQRIRSPFQIGEITIAIDDVLEGPPDTLSMVVVIDHPQTRADHNRMYWSLQRLARALDAANSQRSLTVVLVGVAKASLANLAEIQSIARVLVVNEGLPLAQYLAPLLRLELPAGVKAARDGIERLDQHVHGKKSAKTLTELLESSRSGKKAVQEVYAKWIDDAFASGTGG